MRYELTPGQEAQAPLHIAQTNLNTAGSLVLFVHPKCPCTRATIAELARILRTTKNKLCTTIYFYCPSREPNTWCTDSNLWNESKLLPGVTTKIDWDGKSARSFGAHCSGQILLYRSSDGKLMFSGGITSGRGHEGDSAGQDAIIEFVNTGKSSISSTQVFGCSIGDEWTAPT